MTHYSPTDRLLHRLVLGSGVLPEMLHDVERSRYLNTAPEFSAGRHVFVTGLARAGTTLLMRELYSTGTFGSLTYADMPMVLAPNLWQALPFGKSKGTELQERAHGDGIKVNVNSPEALDEVYWRQFAGDDYLGPKGLSPHTPDAETIAGYADLIRLILRRTGKSRYLSKNNNNLLRIASLSDAWPEAVFLVPMRLPLQHVSSLLGQHRRFAEADRFTRDYMAWLGHHEFGATHRPYLFGTAPEGDPGHLDYWLSVWTSAYEYVASVADTRPNIVIVPYEDLCADPRIWRAVLMRTGTEFQAMSETRKVTLRDAGEHSDALAAKAGAIYDTLRARALDGLNSGA